MTNDQSCAVCWATEIPLTPVGRFSDGGVKMICGLCAPIMMPPEDGVPPQCPRCVRLGRRIAETNGKLARLSLVSLQAPRTISAVMDRVLDEATTLQEHISDEHSNVSKLTAESFS